VPALIGCHKQGRSLDELMERTKEAIELYLEVKEDDIEELVLLGFRGLTYRRVKVLSGYR
jgi:predicted RNase H-like HicB family nuclease